MDDYDEMMKWALGDLDFKYNLRQAIVAWDVRHPELPSIIIDDDDELVGNMKLFMFQITKYWIESKIRYDDSPSLFGMVRGIYRDLFKRKGITA